MKRKIFISITRWQALSLDPGKLLATNLQNKKFNENNVNVYKW